MGFNLTPKQLAIVRFIITYREAKGLAPTLEEIAKELGVSKITVYEHVAQLNNKGAVIKQKYQSRSLVVNPDLIEEVKDLERRNSSPTPGVVSILGRIAAGRPIEMCVDEESLDIGGLVGGKRVSFALKVQGDSMMDDGILNGDYVLVEKRNWASTGETVVAVVPEGDVTLKRFYRDGKKIRLQPANDAHKPLVVDRCDILGVAVGIFRWMAPK